ncbi:FHA domain-containing protein [Clostridium sardiniense]|uniref:FHA domain-containing protein n=1 Tax=Clostridium sardiniense TaxID=29369 RepID=UPI003D34B1B6
MDFSKFIAVVFGIIFIVLLYFIIIYALKIMAKDVKSGGNTPTNAKSNSNTKKPIPSKRRHHGIEIIEIGDNTALKVGSVIPIRDVTTIGRRGNNTVVLSDQYVSGNHAKIMVKNNALILEDLGSTNGTFLNGEKISGRVKLFTKDQIAIGTAVFKVLS